MESKRNDKRRKHNKAGDAEVEQQTRQIHTHKKSRARHHHSQQRQRPPRMKYARDEPQLDSILAKLLFEMRESVRREDRKSDGGRGNKNNDKQCDGARARSALQCERQQWNKNHRIDNARRDRDPKKKRCRNAGIECAVKRSNEESGRDCDIEEVREIVAARSEVADIGEWRRSSHIAFAPASRTTGSRYGDAGLDSDLRPAIFL